VRKFVLAAWIAATMALLLAGGCKSRQEDAPRFATVDKPAPGFTMTDTNGRNWSLAELRGKVVFINFWATWCPPCRSEMPDMEALNRAMRGKPFQMLTILVNDDPNMARGFLSTLGATFPVLIPTDDGVARAYGITGVPETYIIDAEGVLRQKFIGPRPWNSAKSRAMLDGYLP